MTDQTKDDFSGRFDCPHCGNNAPQRIAHRHNGTKSYEDDSVYDGFGWEAGYIYELSICPACEAPVLRSYYWHSMDGEPGDPKVLYPTSLVEPLGLPSRIKQGYRAALKVQNVDANAYAVLLRRVLEMVCIDRNARGKMLAERLKNLSDKREIPANLVDVAKNLKDLGNVGAHADLGDLSAKETPILGKLCLAVLEYVYSAPHIARQAEQSLASLKAKSKRKKRKT